MLLFLLFLVAVGSRFKKNRINLQRHSGAGLVYRRSNFQRKNIKFVNFCNKNNLTIPKKCKSDASLDCWKVIRFKFDHISFNFLFKCRCGFQGTILLHPRT